MMFRLSRLVGYVIVSWRVTLFLVQHVDNVENKHFLEYLWKKASSS